MLKRNYPHCYRQFLHVSEWGKCLFGHHMTNVEIVIPRFGHYVNFASTLAALPGGLGLIVLPKMGKLSFNVLNQWSFPFNRNGEMCFTIEELNDVCEVHVVLQDYVPVDLHQ